MAFMGEPIISSILGLAVDKAASLATEEFAKLLGLKEKMQRLSWRLALIKSLVRDAEAKQVKSDHVRLWFENLKDVAYDIEDLLDECAIEAALRPKGGDEGGASTGAVRWTKRVRDGMCVVSFQHEMAENLKCVEGRVEQIYQDKKFLGLVDLGSQPEARRRRETTPLRAEGSLFVGREGKIEKIKEEMLAFVDRHDSSHSEAGCGTGGSGESKVLVVAIVGMGGMGKTTLAQAIFNDEKMKSNFSLRRWVFVGEDFDVKRLMKDFIKEEEVCSSADINLGDLQERLKNKVSRHQFLIIFDDVWNKNPGDWSPLWDALTYAKKGSVIVVTSRSRDVALADGPVSIYELEGLPYEECWQIFERRAFSGVNSKQYPHLEGLGREIVKKLKGVPLAASMIGGLLGTYLHDERKWEQFLSSTVWPQTKEGDLIDQVVDLSYQHLPSHLKLCFVYCSVFPKDFIFKKKWLVQMWMAQGYIPDEDGRRMEDAGSDYFDDLYHSSFFQLVHYSYVMHDMIHDYAQKVFKEARHMTNDQILKHSMPDHVRHLSLSCDRLQVAEIEKIRRFKKLRTLRLRCEEGIDLHSDFFADFKYLRSVEMVGNGISQLPESIRCLKLVKYLDIQRTGIFEVTELVVCGLCNLQTLRVRYKCEFIGSMSKLVKLRHADCETKCIPMLSGVGKLTLLQELDLFCVTKNDGSKTVELKDLNNLRGCLTIEGLENVETVGEAEHANLKDKVHLEELTLKWRHPVGRQQQQITDGMLESEVLERLRPPPNLKILGIFFGSAGVQLPSWMKEQQRQLSKLVILHLWGCSKWEHLPPLGLLPCLKTLGIRGADGVKEVGREFYGNNHHQQVGVFFPSLETIDFERMAEWEVWDDATEEAAHDQGGDGLLVLFPSLRNLTIRNCPKLSHLPATFGRRLAALQRLHIRGCQQLASSRPLADLLTSAESLQLLHIGDMWLLRWFLLQLQSPTKSRLASLEYLWIQNCDELVSFTDEGEGLRQLTSLRVLNFWCCKNLQCLPSTMHTLPSLESLKLSGCPQMQCLPEGGLPPSLQFLEIGGCPLLAERCREGGPDHPRIPQGTRVYIHKHN